MREQEAVRRLVKSPPELWAQCSDPALLGRHLSRFGEIRITRLEPENTVAWEGESVSGTVEIEASGWGTRVRLTALEAAPEAELVPVPGAAAPPVPVPGAAVPPVPALGAAPRSLTGLFGMLMNRRRPVIDSLVKLEPGGATDAVGEDGAESGVGGDDMTAADLLAQLEAALDSLGAAHHRPYSRG